jgi:hypothetical protein
MHPLARKDKLTVRELPEETLVYDLAAHKLHCLNRTAALVWKHCDGRHDTAALAALLARELRLPSDEADAAARLALEQLGRRGLLQEVVTPAPEEELLSRRKALRKMAVAAVAIPLVMTLKSPTVAWAQGSFACPDNGICPDGSACSFGVARGPHSSFDESHDTFRFCSADQQVTTTLLLPTTTTTTTTTTTQPMLCGQPCEVGVGGCPNGCVCSGSGGVGSQGTCVPG